MPRTGVNLGSEVELADERALESWLNSVQHQVNLSESRRLERHTCLATVHETDETSQNDVVLIDGR